MTPSPSSLVLYLKEIYLFDAILPSFGIHQVEYLSRDQKGREGGERGRKRVRERTERSVMTFSKKMVRWRDGEKMGKILNRKNGCCYLEGVVGVTTGVSHLSNTHIFLCKVCVRCV